MKMIIVMVLFLSSVVLSEQIALTTNGVEVVLCSDTTWMLLDIGKEALDDGGGYRISRVAVTEDSNLVLLSENTWVYLSPDDTFGVQYDEIKMSVLPYYLIDEMPQLQHLPQPEYPIGARVRGDEGRTIIKVLVDKNGEIISAEILKSSGYMELDQAAIKAARNARFKPAKYKGYPVRVYVSLPYTFRLTAVE
ncbi:MAG: energy transducer TonB [candidate division WOR-3 bacterium]|nr:MAG: energy transducer TonB [candidate division WOR-3 bacterium]